MSRWKNARGLRGSAFEETINLTNEQYRKAGLALVQKIPTPIKPIDIDSERHVITLAYFEQKSTVDYIGVMGGIPICFDAKECGKKSLPFSNIHPHQVSFMSDFARHGGIAFLLVHFTDYGETYVLPIEVLEAYFLDKEGRSSIPYSAFERELLIPDDGGPYLNYLSTVLKYSKARAALEKKRAAEAEKKE
ncbi:MAG: Holliday junction resolvase RecU [Lachnospiraceae bacterium]|nr:Holliday junction resolvase RecU [Lachnospiraceae bacterium]